MKLAKANQFLTFKSSVSRSMARRGKCSQTTTFSLKRCTRSFSGAHSRFQMENLAFLSEEYIKWVIAVVATLIPGVTYAEIAATAIQFILSGELEEIVRQLRNDPAEVIKRLLERLRDELFTPENVW